MTQNSNWPHVKSPSTINKSIKNHLLDNKKATKIILLIAIFLLPTNLFAQEKAKEKEKTWQSSLGLSYVTVSGNSAAETFSLSGDMLRKKTDSQLKFDLQTIYAKSDGQETAKYWKLGSKYDQDINEKWYWLGLASAEGNKLAGYNLRLKLNPGIGHHFLKGTHELKGEIGPGYFFEKREADKDVSAVSGRAYISYKYNITEKAYFSQDAEYLHLFRSSDDYRIETNTMLVVQISDWISLKTGVTVKYVNKQPVGFEHTDVFTSTSLVFTF